MKVFSIPCIILLSCSAFGSGCSRPGNFGTVPTTHYAWGNGFRLTAGNGSGLSGYDLISIESDGSCDYIFRDGNTVTTKTDGTILTKPLWKEANFKLETKELQEVASALESANLFSLRNEYHGGERDGHQAFVRFWMPDAHKGVYCDNRFPPEMIQLLDFIFRKLPTNHPLEVMNAGAMRGSLLIKLTPGMFPNERDK